MTGLKEKGNVVVVTRLHGTLFTNFVTLGQVGDASKNGGHAILATKKRQFNCLF